MFVKHLRLRNFRNIASTDLRFFPGLNLIFGKNAQGKSNLIDALHFLTFLESFRGGRDRAMIREGEDWAMAEAEVRKSDATGDEFRLVLHPGEKFVRLNGEAVTRQDEYFGRFHAYFFFPDDLTLITGEPGTRRELLDLAVVRALPETLEHIRTYNQTLSQRNALLKKVSRARKEERPEPDGWEELAKGYTRKLAESGSRVVESRLRFVGQVGPRSEQLYGWLSSREDASLSVSYVSFEGSALVPGEFDRGEHEERIFSAQQDELSSDIRRGYTSKGPHRDDLEFAISDQLLRNFGSQGQIRTSVLAFKLALCQFATDYGEPPILCLDDALSELDDTRRLNLLDVLGEMELGQVFITLASETELELVSDFVRAIYRVEEGRIARAKKPSSGSG